MGFEKLGIPTITVVTSQFSSLARAVALSENVAEMCFAEVPHPMGMIPPAEIEQKAAAVFPEILSLATDWQPLSQVSANKNVYPAEHLSFNGTIGELNDYSFREGWSLGIPIIPPETEAVARMLKGTRRSPDAIIGKVPPRMATLTVELAAVHAVMAGCKPEYLPLLIAAMEALLDPAVNWRGALATTATSQTVVIVNGPVVREIGLASEQGAAGKGYHPNAAIGYSINLIAFIVGASRPPEVDKSTLGSPGDFLCWVFGENEKRLPAGWEPFHVDRGFKREDSVVTVVASYPAVDNADHWSVTPQEHARWWGKVVCPVLNLGGPCSPGIMDLNPVIAIGPEHAQLVNSAGWDKSDFRKAVWEQSRIPLSTWPADCRDTKRLSEIFGPLTPETMIPVTFKPEQLQMVVAGGDGKHSHYFAPAPGSYITSKPVNL